VGVGPDLGSDQPGQAGLAGPGGTEEDCRAQPAGLELSTKHSVRPDEMFLAEHVGEPRRSQALGQRGVVTPALLARGVKECRTGRAAPLTHG
jgi:hypothetical protein